MSNFTLPDLPYDFAALEPWIDEQTMHLHHDKHHQGYLNKFVGAVTGTELEQMSVEQILADLSRVPENIRTTVRNNGGGYANHSLFWQVMAPNAGGTPSGALAEAINGTFGSHESFVERFSAAATGRFGSGWAWLVVKSDGGLAVVDTANQDSPISDGHTPVLGLDVWEHAYYLKYQNRRPDYIKAWWNVVNWKAVEERFKKALG